MSDVHPTPAPSKPHRRSRLFRSPLSRTIRVPSAAPRARRAVALGAVLSLAVAPSATAQDWTGETADQMVSYDDNEYARAVQILFGDDGSLHLLWGEDAPSVRELHYGRSTDEGATWTCSAADRVISFPDGNALYEEPSVATGEGDLLVVWSEDHEATREVHYGVSADGGLTWSSESADQILSDPASAVDTQIPTVVHLDGVWHVVWTQNTGVSSEVHYSRSTDGGATWSGSSGDRVISFPDGGNAIDAKIAAGGSTLYVVWREVGDGGYPTIHLGLSTDGGLTWTSESTDRELSPAVTLMTSFAISAAPYGFTPTVIVFAASLDTSSPYHYEIYSLVSEDGGATWAGSDALFEVSHDEDHARSASNVDVFVAACAPPIAVWDEEEDASGTKEQHYSLLEGGWTGATTDQILSFPDGENGYRPSIAGNRWAIPFGRSELDTWVAWTEFAGGQTDNYEVHFSKASLCTAGSVDDDGPASTLEFRVAPNPGRDAIRFEAPGVEGRLDVDLFDAGGRLVRSLASPTGGSTPVWDGRDASGRALPAGAYFARVRSDEGSATRTVILRP